MKKSWLILILVFVLAIILPWLLFFRKSPLPNKNPVATSSDKTKAEPTFEAINGVLVSEDVSKNRPIGVMVENFPEARPQSGLVDADLVYEAPTEGGITRFMAVYQTTLAKSIGPIRSARVYFAELANELGAVYAHVGGNSDALANIKVGLYPQISNADQFFNDPYFQRVSFRKMPHNVYTSIEVLEKLILKHEFENTAVYQPWKFKSDEPTSSSTASNIKVDFSLKDYAVNWIYNGKDNSYKRILAGKPHKDLDSGKQIVAKNIIVQFIQTSPSNTDTVLSINIDLDSGGKAVVFFDGNAQEVTWKKQDGRTRYFDANNNEIMFNRGTTWVELVPIEKQPNLTWS